MGFVWTLLSVVLLLPAGAGQSCGEKDFSILYDSRSYFTVSSLNNTCMCPGGFSGPGNLLTNLAQQPEVSTLIQNVSTANARMSLLQADLAVARANITSTSGSAQSCPPGQFVSGITAAGSITCSASNCTASAASPTGSATLPTGSLTMFSTAISWSASWSGSGISTTLSIPGIVPGIALLADVFITTNGPTYNNMSNFVFGSDCLGNVRNWVTRGNNPRTDFSPSFARQCAVCDYTGGLDAYTSYFGVWCSSQTIPQRPDGRFDMSIVGPSPALSGYVYFVVRGQYVTPAPYVGMNLRLLTTPMVVTTQFTGALNTAVSLPAVPTFGTAPATWLMDVFATVSISDHVGPASTGTSLCDYPRASPCETCSPRIWRGKGVSHQPKPFFVSWNKRKAPESELLSACSSRFALSTQTETHAY
eukprot:TRINITY_DN10281_c0_g2_i6.p1 TRINITY_DN10281_c0_g2~~TRINITY_DN10281_c0_g2_i6.p1  ORF type:complete len:419 (+),score=39.79 TRINITY_DN10281_c0_g2_i6:37-1293(+)